MSEALDIDERAGALARAVACHKRGEWAAALAHCEQVLAVRPDHAGARHLAGQALLGRRGDGDVERAIALLRRAVGLDDTRAALHNDLGTAYWSVARIDEALEAFLRAQSLQPTFVQAVYNAGNCYWFMGRFSLAEAQYRRTLDLDANWEQAHYMLGNCRLSLGRPGEAVDAYQQALRRRGQWRDARLGMAAALLKSGRWREGWGYFDSRLETDYFAPFRDSARPMWDGAPRRDATLLVYGEQGIGDQLQFARFLAAARERVGRLMLIADRSIHPLLGRLPGVDELIDKADRRAYPAAAQYDAWVPMMSLARIHGAGPRNIPGEVPYLACDEDKAAYWRGRLDASSMNVGLVWSGNPAQQDNAYRSLPLSTLRDVGAGEGIALYSLQVGAAANELAGPGNEGIVDLSAELADFADTAAVISCLDAVVSVDTAVAHLAGALGRPVLNLLWTGHCWRYLQGGEGTPWYPTMRLFRQPTCGDWASVAAAVGQRLESMAGPCRARRQDR